MSISWVPIARSLDQSEDWQNFITQLFEEFKYFDNLPSMRTGQALMNGLYQFRPDLYDRITGTQYDPFYDEHDGKIPSTVLFLYE